ncbi:hypothetical protein [Acidianus sp. HS-5]|uniref:hypothetical protein n=1 Tax=Acidianus sp. HS-5 TaxID=2886040 RepID=UPI001F230348|nr:hypothetical protein [Acidianus sp. HS-5]BDC18900.1 hypothetical protein HS5_17900 [Acidianus sp. HS-5]
MMEEEFAKFLEEYAEYLKSKPPLIDIPLSPKELLAEASRIRAKSRVKLEGGKIVIYLDNGKTEHWAHLEGEIIITFDKLYRPLKVEIEIKDTMDSEKVLKNLKNEKISDIEFLIDDGFIEIYLAKGDAEHWAHLEGEIIMALDESYKPLRLEIEIKDTMDSEKVLKNAGLLSSS